MPRPSPGDLYFKSNYTINLETNFNLKYKPESPDLPGFWWKCGSPKAALIIVHGMGEHVGRYAHVASFLNKKSISVLGVDLTGFGNAHGKKGHGKDILEMKSILQAKISFVKKQYPDLPIFVFGQSMGANITLNYQLTELDDRVTGYIAASPWIQTGKPLSPLLISAAKVLSKILPKVTKSNELDVQGIANLQTEIDKYIDDPLVHDRVSFGFGYSMFLSAEYLNNYDKGGVHTPTLIAHSKDDILTSAKASKEFCVRNPKNLVFLEKNGLKHELHNSDIKEEILKEYYEWIEELI
jgi:acylglycerol lipase